MDSSPDLSLKLRRGSNDSRDSYYMDFAQGIDSDIEEVATVATPAPGNVDVASDSSDSQAAAAALAAADLPPADDLDNDEQAQPELVIDEPLPPTPPPPVLETAFDSIPPMPTISTIPTIPPGPLTSSAMNNLTDTSTTDEEDFSQNTPLPMPILPPLKTDVLQMHATKIPLVDDDEG